MAGYSSGPLERIRRVPSNQLVSCRIQDHQFYWMCHLFPVKVWKKPKLSPSDESKLVRMFRNNSKLLEHQHDRQRLSDFLKMTRGIFIGVGVSSSNQRTLHQLSSTMLVQSKKWLNNKEGELPPNSSASPQISSQKVKTLTQLNIPMGQ